MSRITSENIQDILQYRSETGVFIWVSPPGSKMKQGDRAGYLDKKKGYRSLYYAGKKYKEHRLAWLYITGEWPKDQIDHINHIRADNRWVNLREATNSENQRNKNIPKNNTSGTIGVYFDKQAAKWKAVIRIWDSVIYLGHYVDIEEAIYARKKAEEEHGFHTNHGIRKPPDD